MAEEPPEDGGYEFREQADASTLRSRGHLQLSLGGKEDVDGEEYVDGKEDVDSGELQLVRRLGWSPYSKLPIKIVSNDDGTTQELPLGKYYEGTLSDQRIQCLMITKRNFPLLERELWFQKVLHDLREISQSDTSVSISDNILLTKHLLIAEDVSGNKPGYFICYCPFSVTLSNHIRNLDRSAILSIFSGICNGLVYLHLEHIVHCTLTPSSIALAQHPMDRNLLVPKIMNFSRARLLENRDRYGIMGLFASHLYNMVAALTPVRLLSTPNMAATPYPLRSSPAFFPDNNSWILDASVSPYMSPEAMKDIFTEAHDIYSLGCIIYETVTGRTPRHDDLNSNDLNGMDYGINFGTIISSCTEHERKKRMTAREIIEELKNMPILCKEERHSKSEQDDGHDSMSDTEHFYTPQSSWNPSVEPCFFDIRSKPSFILPFQEPLKSSFKNGWSPSHYIDVQFFRQTSLSGFGVSFDLKDIKNTYVWYIPEDEALSACFLWQEFSVEVNPHYKEILNRRRHQLLIEHPNLAKCLGITVQLIDDSEWIGVYEECTSCSLEHFIHNHWQGEFTKEQKIWLITSITKQLLQLVCDLQRKGVCVAAQVQNSINSKNVRLRISSNYEDFEPNCCSQNAFIYHHVKFSLVSLEDDIRYRPPEYLKEVNIRHYITLIPHLMSAAMVYPKNILNFFYPS
jgi:serine/threonine protein kinase